MEPDVRYVADSPEDLREKVSDPKFGERARVRIGDRVVLMEAVDGGPFGLIWEERRED